VDPQCPACSARLTFSPQITSLVLVYLPLRLLHPRSWGDQSSTKLRAEAEGKFTLTLLSSVKLYRMELYGGTRCDERSSPSYWNFGLSMFVLLDMLSGVGLLTSPSFILLGILVSYLPQHVRIISRRSSEGISPYFVLLGTTSGTCAFANIVTLPPSQRDLACCKELNGFDCVAGLLGIAQVGVQWACFTVM
jgi:hypothetical protein